MQPSPVTVLPTGGQDMTEQAETVVAITHQILVLLFVILFDFDVEI